MNRSAYLIVTCLTLFAPAALPAQEDLHECKGVRCQAVERYHAAQARVDQGAGMQALAGMAENRPDLSASPELMKQASDAQAAPITGKTQPPAPIHVPDPEEGNRYYGGVIRHDAEKGKEIAVTGARYPMRLLASATKLPFAAIGGIFGGLFGAAKAVFSKDDDDHNNYVGAGFMLGASMLGHAAGKVAEKIFSIPVIVAGAIGTLVGGLVGLVRGIFS